MRIPRERLRVAFLTHAGAAQGGAEESLVLFLIALRSALDATVVLFEDGAFADRLRGLGIRTEIVAMPRALMSATRERVGLLGLKSLPRSLLRLAGTLRRGRYDVVLTNSVKAHFVGAPAARLAGLPCVLHVHDILYGRPRLALTALARHLGKERVACSRAAAAALDAPPVTVIHGPLDASRYDDLLDKREARRRLGLDAESPLVAIVGRINRWKGHDRYLRIAAMVNERVSARFAVVGSPVFRDETFLPELHRLAESLSIRERVHFIPWVDDPRVVYAAIDLHCNCSSAEPFGRTSIEAAAAGVPTVCFDDGGSAEAIVPGVTGVAVPPGDERAFADAVVFYLRDPAALAAASSAARRDRPRFDVGPASLTLYSVLRRAAYPTDPETHVNGA